MLQSVCVLGSQFVEEAAGVVVVCTCELGIAFGLSRLMINFLTFVCMYTCVRESDRECVALVS